MKVPEETQFDPKLFLPTLVAGETVIGYMDVEYVPPRQTNERRNDPYTDYGLKKFMYGQLFQSRRPLNLHLCDLVRRVTFV